MNMIWIDQNGDDFAAFGRRFRLIRHYGSDFVAGWLVKIRILELLTLMVADITPDHDSKLQELLTVLREKVTHQLTGNRKIIIFTAFADTAISLRACQQLHAG